MITTFRLLLLSATLLSPLAGQCTQGGCLSAPMERAFKEGGRIHFKLSAGGYKITPVPGNDRIVVRWSTERPEHMDRVRVDIEAQNGDATIHAKGPRSNFQVEIQVPCRSHLDVDMSVGDLSIQGIEGDKLVDLNIGEVKIEVPNPQAYRTARASVKIGEVNARAFRQRQEGFFNAVKWRGEGQHELDVRLGIGEVQLR